jgi:hypothetical protein
MHVYKRHIYIKHGFNMIKDTCFEFLEILKLLALSLMSPEKNKL